MFSKFVCCRYTKKIILWKRVNIHRLHISCEALFYVFCQYVDKSLFYINAYTGVFHDAVCMHRPAWIFTVGKKPHKRTIFTWRSSNRPWQLSAYVDLFSTLTETWQFNMAAIVRLKLFLLTLSHFSVKVAGVWYRKLLTNIDRPITRQVTSYMSNIFYWNIITIFIIDAAWERGVSMG